jgi:peptide/nickel transport system substrate-binding protein
MRKDASMRGVGLVAALVVASLLLSGSGLGWAAAPRALTYGIEGDPDTLDIAVSSATVAWSVAANITSVLVRQRLGSASEIEPDLATSWSVSPDGTVWTFKLRRGVTFHDGTPWNAQAAKINIDRWADPNNPYHQKQGDFTLWERFFGPTFKEARVTDPYTLQIVLSSPYGPFLIAMTQRAFQFLSPAALAKYGGAEIGRHPVGTGPYKFVEWTAADHVLLEANPSYFRHGLPKTTRVYYRVMKDNSARYLAIKAGELDIMEVPNPEDVQAARADQNLRVALRPPLDDGLVVFNLHMPLLQDRRIREAVALAINRPAIVRALYGGLGQVADQFLPPTAWGRSTAVTAYPYDPQAAMKLLTEARYPNGFSIDFWYMPVNRPYYPDAKAIATAMANDLGKVGIRVNLRTEDWAAYIADVHTGLKFPISMWGILADYGDPDAFWQLFSQYKPNSVLWSYNNPTTFTLIKQARTMTDQAARARLYAQVAEITQADIPRIPIAYGSGAVIVRRNVQGYVANPNSEDDLSPVWLR